MVYLNDRVLKKYKFIIILGKMCEPSSSAYKRASDQSGSSDHLNKMKQLRRSLNNDISDNDMSDSIEMTSEYNFLSTIPQISINESPRSFDVSNVKRENNDAGNIQPQSPTTMMMRTFRKHS